MKNIKIRKAVQKGFTLLELLVVITILAILATGALLAYEGVTDTAQGAAASNNTVTADQSIRNYKAVTGNYPNQWDHLIAQDGTTGADLAFVSDVTYNFLAKVDASALSGQIQDAFFRVGVDEIQVRTASGVTLTPGVEPNLQHNEGAIGNNAITTELELYEDGQRAAFFNRMVVVPAGYEDGTLCTYGAAKPENIRANRTVSVTDANGALISLALNKINDKFEDGECHFVAAFGFGGDAAKSTTGSAVAIAAAPTYTSRLINPSTTYARYIALFHLGADKDEDGTIGPEDIFQKPVLVGVVDAEGKIVDQNIAVANTTTQQ